MNTIDTHASQRMPPGKRAGTSARLYTLMRCAATLVMVGAFAFTGCPDNTPPPDTTPPSSVSDVTADAGSEQVTLSWTNPADSDFDHVQITWQPADGAKTLSAAQSGNSGESVSAIIDMLTNGIPYTFQIITADSSGNEADGVTVSATPGQDSDNDGIPDSFDMDDDNDGFLDANDNCPLVVNDDQTNTDGVDDGGDACDTDDDNDSILDSADSCAIGEIGWISDAGTDNDGDGCRDAGEDTNDDNDNFLDVNDNCPLVVNDDQPNTDGADDGGDACDTDDDNDSILDSADSCAIGEIGWISDAGTDNDGDGCRDAGEDVDDDNDGLIEINTVDMLNNMRYSLNGVSYKTSNTSAAITDGAPNGGLNGYELARNLDFAEQTSYDTNSPNFTNNTWRPTDGSGVLVADPDTATNAGWVPIGDGAYNFNALFDGNSFTIHNLYVRADALRVGFFGYLDSNAVVRNLGLIDGNVYTTKPSSIGGVAGWNSGTIEDVSFGGAVTTAIAVVSIDDFLLSVVGGLVGANHGPIRSSYSDATVRVGTNVANQNYYIGGFVGFTTAPIYDGYATGAVTGGGADDNVGGFVGFSEGVINFSYATGDVDGGAGADDVGGLVGTLFFGSHAVVTSYATGAVNGGADNDKVGGLVGTHLGSATGFIHNSYATGAVNGGDGNDAVGGFIGYTLSSPIYSSYAIGNVAGGDGSDDVGGFIGYALSADITNSFAIGDSNGDAGDDIVGLFIGNDHFDATAIAASYSNSDAASDTIPATLYESASVSLNTLQSSVASNSTDQTPYYRWTTVEGDGWMPDESDLLSIYCDTDNSGAIDVGEMAPTNFIWDWGATDQLPAITCTPGGVTSQRM